MKIRPEKEAEYAHFIAPPKDNVGVGMMVYANGIVEFADKWAELMEHKIEAGEQLEDIAKASADVISEEMRGITGFMYGMACNILASFWIHGERLRVWHNRRYGVNDTEENKNRVVNPAILTITPKES